MIEPAGSLILIHGAGSGPHVFDGWKDALEGLELRAIDLHHGLDVGSASMRDYADAVVAAAAGLPAPIALCGWSMGGLVAMMAAQVLRPEALILIEPSPPAEIQGYDRSIRPAPGRYDPEAAYGSFPAGSVARPESALARGERKRGVSVPWLPSRTLVVSGREFADDRGRKLAETYGCAVLDFPELDHWGLVFDRRIAQAVARFVGSKVRV